MSGLLARLRETDSVAVGTWVKIPALETVELLAHAGFDFIVVDQEHSPLTLESAYRAIVVGQALGMSVIVRVPDRSGSYVQRILDSGADGILVPQVADAAQAREVVGHMVFSPHGGTRGMGITSRAGLWGLRSRDEYLQHGRDEVARIVQLEDQSALEQVEDVLDAPGLNAAFIGLGDLTLSTGKSADDPMIEGLVDKFLAAGRARSLPCGTAVGTAKAAQAAAERGFSFVMVSNDAAIFGQAATRLANEVSEALGRS